MQILTFDPMGGDCGVWKSGVNAFTQNIGLGFSHIRSSEEDTPVEIGNLDTIMIYNHQTPDSGLGKVLANLVT
jgi:hypothetical protein